MIEKKKNKFDVAIGSKKSRYYSSIVEILIEKSNVFDVAWRKQKKSIFWIENAKKVQYFDRIKKTIFDVLIDKQKRVD